MFDDRHYVPILKGKQGEYFALRDLNAAIKASLTPIVEVPPIEWDFDEGRAKNTIGEHVNRVPEKVRDAWGTDRPLFVDLGLVADEGLLQDGTHPVTYVFAGLRTEGVQAIPVTGLDRPADFHAAIADVVQQDGRGVCIRLIDEDFDDVAELEKNVGALLERLGLTPGNTHVVIDLRAIPVGQANALALAARAILNTLPHVAEWATLTLAGTAFPENLSGFETAAISTTERTEWLLWRSLIVRGNLPRNPTFGDYAIAHPDITQIDPRFMRMTAQLRYTVEENWLIFKKRNVRDHGFDQFNDICRDLVARPEYSGRNYSWGDTYVDDCAKDKDGPGNATTWRRVANTHHMTYVVNQLANLP